MNEFIKKFFVQKTCAYIHYDEISGDTVKHQTRKFPNPELAKQWIRKSLSNRPVCNVRFVVAQKLDLKMVNPDNGEIF